MAGARGRSSHGGQGSSQHERQLGVRGGGEIVSDPAMAGSNKG